MRVAVFNFSTNNLSFEFREISYFSYPAEGQKRWWLDAVVKVITNDPYWASEETKFGQVCLTRGHPLEGQSYLPGLIHNTPYLGAWDCQSRCTLCVKCNAVDAIFASHFGEFQWLIDQLSTSMNNLDVAIFKARNFRLINRR